MKKILLTTLAVILAIVPALAGTFSNDYRLSGFTGIRASNVFSVELSPSANFSVGIEAPDYLEPYIIVEVSRNQLVLRMKELPKSISRKLSDERAGAVRAIVKMPLLESVSLSGAAALNAEGTFPTLRDRAFQLDLSGASHAKGLSLSAPSAIISLSGATEAGLTGRFTKVSLEISGAGRIKMGVEVSDLDAELSGSAETFDEDPS